MKAGEQKAPALTEANYLFFLVVMGGIEPPTYGL